MAQRTFKWVLECEALIPLESWDADCCPECHAPVATLETPRHPTVPITREA